MQYTIECFANTGFTPSNVPDSANRLRSLVTPITLDAVWLLQNRGRGSVKVSTTFDTIKNVDYCFIGDTYYWVTNILMHNENMCELELSADYLTTIGISNLNVSSGWCTRRHVQDDALFSNIIDESFDPSEPLKLDLGQMLTPGEHTGDLEIALATVYLAGDITSVAKTFTDDVTSLTVTVPVIPAVVGSTLYTMTADKPYSRKVPSTCAFNYEVKKIRDNIQAVRSLGIEQAITGSYLIPEEYITYIAPDGQINTITGKKSLITSSINPIYQAGIKNKKVFSGQYQKIILTSVASNSQEEYEAHDIYESGNYQFIVFCDPSPEGRPYCKPAVYHGDTDNYFMGTVVGQTWQNQPIAYTQTSGEAVAIANTRREITRGTISGVTNATTNALGAVGAGVSGNPVGAISGIAGTTTGIVNTLFDVSNLAYQRNVSNIIVAPTINFARISGIQNYIGNYFYVYRYRLSDNDTVRFDNYLTQFGYACSEPLTQACFVGRQFFNFVQAESVNLSCDYPMSIRLGAIAQLNSGVRVWHALPSISAMYNNPIV